VDRDTITALTIAIMVYRKLRQMGVYDMPIELKGIRGKAIKAAQNIERLNLAYDKFNEAAPAHAADVEGLAPQIESLSEDLTFAAQTLGNSVNGSAGSGESTEQPKALPAVQQPETPSTAQGGSGAIPESQFRG
jgi:hypothetical protein